MDLDHLKSWIGRTEVRSDLLTPRLAEAFDAMLDEEPRRYESGDEAPLGIHWCLGNPGVRASGLGRDGHPKREGFMPPVPLPRRMWAAGALTFHAPLIVGLNVTRQTTIASLELKKGRSGLLCFLELDHLYMQEGLPCVTERQTLVYREDPKLGESPPEPAATGDACERIVQTITPDPVLLFRYSAVTFNGHRIHYDQEYARKVEGYPDLVVHGPLIATLLLRAAAREGRGRRIEHFAFRGLSPSFVGRPLSLATAPVGEKVEAKALSDGRVSMAAQGRFAS
ncbi:MAG: protein dehydratase [Microvirga sp.]|jgi:3-methylfumaryl-CoA hydratase|nr:protein dehydratase [Microvirga sp.]